MAKSLGSLVVILGADTKKFSAGMRSAQKSVKLMDTSIAKLGVSLGALFGARALVGQIREMVDLFGQQELAERRMAEGLRLVGITSRAALEDMKSFASSIQQVTTMGDEAVLELAALGASLGRMSGQQLKDATIASIGLAKAAGIDAASAMKLLARAAQGGSVEFSRYGIVVDKTMSAQDQFYQVIQFGKESFALARAEAETFNGKLEQLNNTIGDLKENLGGPLADALISWIEWLNDSIGAVNYLTDSLGDFSFKMLTLSAAIGKLFEMTPPGWLLKLLGFKASEAFANFTADTLVEKFNAQEDAKFAERQKEHAKRIAEERAAQERAALDKFRATMSKRGRLRDSLGILSALGVDTSGVGVTATGGVSKTISPHDVRIGGTTLAGLGRRLSGFVSGGTPVSDLAASLKSAVFGAPKAISDMFAGQTTPQNAGAFARGTIQEFQQRLRIQGGRDDTAKKTERNTSEIAQHTKTLVDVIREFALGREQAVAVSI